jgi:hypothetical protein
MMSRGEFQWAHWVRGVRERPWTLMSCSSVVSVVVDVGVGVDVVELVFGLFVAMVACSMFGQQLLRTQQCVHSCNSAIEF